MRAAASIDSTVFAWRCLAAWSTAAITITITIAVIVGAAPANAADLARAADQYNRMCSVCHGAKGRPTLPGTPDFTQPMTLARSDFDMLARVREGKGAMPAFRGQLRDREILDILMHIRSMVR